MIILEKYRDPWLIEKANEYIGFYTREFYCLDNFSAFKIRFQGHLYSTVGYIETAPEIAKAIMTSASPYDALTISHENIEKRRPDWNDVKVEIMEQLLRAKTEQHPYVKKKLIATGDHILVEDSPTDSFWGCGPNRDGANMLGKLGMKLRDELKNE